MDNVKKLPKISVLVTTFNRCEILKHCLSSVLTQDYPTDLLDFTWNPRVAAFFATTGNIDLTIPGVILVAAESV